MEFMRIFNIIFLIMFIFGAFVMGIAIYMVDSGKTPIEKINKMPSLEKETKESVLHTMNIIFNTFMALATITFFVTYLETK